MERREIKIVVTFFRKSTNERVDYEAEGSINEDGCFEKFIWEEGNFSCDCNRATFMYGDRIDSIYPDDDDPCGDSEIVIEKIVEKDKPDIVLYKDERA